MNLPNVNWKRVCIDSLRVYVLSVVASILAAFLVFFIVVPIFTGAEIAINKITVMQAQQKTGAYSQVGAFFVYVALFCAYVYGFSVSLNKSKPEFVLVHLVFIALVVASVLSIGAYFDDFVLLNWVLEILVIFTGAAVSFYVFKRRKVLGR